MNLKDFVADALRQIIEGVAEAQRAVDWTGARINPADNSEVAGAAQGINSPSLQVPVKGYRRRHFIQTVEFDVAVVVSREKETAVKGGIEALRVVSAAAARDTSEGQETTSRVKFALPVLFPVHPGSAIVGGEGRGKTLPPWPTRPPSHPAPPTAPASE